VLVTHWFAHRFATPRIPHPRSFVVRYDDDPASAGAETDRLDPRPLAYWFANHLTTFRVPHLRGPPGCNCDPASVGTKTGSRHHAGLHCFAQRLVIAHIPHLRRILILRDGEDPLAVSTETCPNCPLMAHGFGGGNIPI